MPISNKIKAPLRVITVQECGVTEFDKDLYWVFSNWQVKDILHTIIWNVVLYFIIITMLIEIDFAWRCGERSVVRVCVIYRRD